ncbi:MAG: hypothetical protein WC299_00600 [Kiritimatiellia bacterium]
MKSKVRLLSLVVSFTLILLTIGAVLVVLGIFNEALKWDIFGPKLEALLYGVFGSCMALAVFGFSMTVIIAMQELVLDFKKLVQARTNQENVPEAPKRIYAARMLAVVVVMAVLVGLCASINHVVLTQRCKVFKRLAGEQLANFQKKISGIVDGFTVPPQNNVPRDLYDVVKTLNNLDFIARTTLYVSDPTEKTAMWGFTAWRNYYTNSDGFARFYIAKDFEKAMRQAMDGTSMELDQINSKNEFTWYQVIAGSDNKPKAVVRIDGDNRQSFREYKLGK